MRPSLVSPVHGRKRMALAESVLDNLVEVVFQIDCGGNWVFLNQAWLQLTGHIPADSLGKRFIDDVHPDDRAECCALFQSLISRRAGECRHEVRYRHRDDSYRWVEAFARCALDEDGRLAGVAGTLTDVSARKAADDQLRLAASVFTNAGEGIMITSSAGLILDVNAAFETITGYTRAEVLGRSPKLLSSGRQDAAFYADMWRNLDTHDYWQGEIYNRRKSGEAYVERLTITTIRDGAGQPANYVGIFSDITIQKIQAEHLDKIAHYDPLTGLPNRRLLADRLQQAMARSRRDGTRVAVVYVDLDGFKAVNDEHGHEIGDRLLVAIGRRMQLAVRELDTVARIGGDEFVVVIGDIRPPEDCLSLIARLLECVREPAFIEDAQVCVTGSLGVSFYPQDEDINADQLMRQADQAMYRAKDLGKNRYCVFDSAGHRSALDRNSQLEEIERAIAKREFVLHYQPIIDLRTGRLNSVEALVRWMHPERGCLGPGEFLPLIEGHPLTIPLENWILGEALDQHQRWLDAGWDIAVSVNMSGTQLHQRDFVQRLRTALATRPRVDPRRLKLEVLETSALHDIAHVSRTISQCAEFGVSFSLDDFGTGYSSLRYLKQLPARRIKIDQSFVKNMLQDPDDLAILEGVIGMAAAFKRELVAEGVESMAHAKMLIQLGCFLAQGFGIARPMPGERLVEWASGWTLPPSLRGCTALDREHALLLGALVEYRAWTAAVLRQAAAPAPDRVPDAMQDSRMEQWLTAVGAATPDCPAWLRPLLALRDALHAAGAELLASGDDAATDNRSAAAKHFSGLAADFLGMLGAGLESPR